MVCLFSTIVSYQATNEGPSRITCGPVILLSLFLLFLYLSTLRNCTRRSCPAVTKLITLALCRVLKAAPILQEDVSAYEQDLALVEREPCQDLDEMGFLSVSGELAAHKNALRASFCHIPPLNPFKIRLCALDKPDHFKGCVLQSDVFRTF